MKLDGFGIAGYRSFGDEMVCINDLGNVNVFIGKNNTGKSNILKFCKHLSKIQEALSSKKYNGFNEDLDYCVDSKEKDIKFAYQIKRNSKATGELYTRLERGLPLIKDIPDLEKCMWFYYSVRHQKIEPLDDMLARNMVKYLDSREILKIVETKLGHDFGIPKLAAKEIARNLYGTNVQYFPFKVHSIDIFRQITKGESKADLSNFSGPGLITKLRRVQSPDRAQFQKDIEKFETINKFIQDLIGENDAFLQVPAEEDVINVSIRGRMLPLDNVGTGIHELIIMASAVIWEEDVVFCIEEPEIHIHPELQKKFIRYLQFKTKNQYLISTHSNACFDIPGVNIYHCKLINGLTRCELVTTNLEKLEILSDLGNKLSDLLQANYVIWVEGPSDKIYLNHWINGLDKSLEEGIHYSIMFYGGSHLSHITYDSPEGKDFFQLCNLNRNVAIIMDSDRESAGKRIDSIKNRVRKNFKDNKCFVWVTKVREIENYVNQSIFNSAINQVHNKAPTDVAIEEYYYKKITKLENGGKIDKIKVAKKVADNDPDYSILDLKKKINALIRRILKANS